MRLEKPRAQSLSVTTVLPSACASPFSLLQARWKQPAVRRSGRYGRAVTPRFCRWTGTLTGRAECILQEVKIKITPSFKRSFRKNTPSTSFEEGKLGPQISGFFCS